MAVGLDSSCSGRIIRCWCGANGTYNGGMGIPWIVVVVLVWWWVDSSSGGAATDGSRKDRTSDW